MKNVAILGFGTVGSGVYEVLKSNEEKITANCGETVKIKYILDIRDFSSHPDAELFTKDFNVILEDSSVDIVAEVIGGVHPAYDFTKAALLAGKSVVTSNKELVATMGTELLEIAKDKNVNYMFEASVGGGIPVIRPLHNCLAGNEISEIEGILNGTTNFILTEMLTEGREFDDVLKEAQSLGYAERNPAADVDGIDACRKISILMSLVTGKQMDCEKIHTEGIRGIDGTDVAYATALGGAIKLIGYGYVKDEKMFAAVCPTIVKNSNPLSAVNGVYNGICAKGNAVGDVMFYGKGAGKLPTASAVVGDICDIAKDTTNKNYFWEAPKSNEILPYPEAAESYLVRVSGADRTKVVAKFGSVTFLDAPVNKDEFAFIAPEMKNMKFDTALLGMPVIKKIRIGQE